MSISLLIQIKEMPWQKKKKNQLDFIYFFGDASPTIQEALCTVLVF